MNGLTNIIIDIFLKFSNFLLISGLTISIEFNLNCTLCENCPNTEFFLDYISLHLNQLKKMFNGPFLGMGFNRFKATEPIRGEEFTFCH